jgi:hypothetical protein
MEDVVTPNYKARISNGEIINNPMTLSEVQVVEALPTMFNRKLLSESGGKIYGDEWSGYWPMSATDLGEFLVPSQDDAFQPYVDNLINRAVAAAHANASSNEMQALMVLAEGKKSIESMKTILYRLFKIFRALKTLDYKYLRKQISRKELEDRYMELRYAIRPLMIDAQNTVKALEVSKNLKSMRATARGFAKGVFENDDVITIDGYLHTSEVKRWHRVETDVRAGILTDVELTNLSVWGADQFLETMWEITPFSFIFGWFFNIADIIAGFSPSVGVKQLASWVVVEHTSILRNELVSTANVCPDCNYADERSWSGHRDQLEHWKIRTVDPELSLIPSLKVNLDAFKLLDLIIIGKKMLSSYNNRRR